MSTSTDISARPAAVDPVKAEVVRHALIGVADEMKGALMRSAHNAIIYEVLDFSTGVFDARGRLAAQSAGLSIFLGTLDWAVAAVLAKFEARLRPGDVYLTNDPYEGGGTHLSDVSVVEPVFVDDRLAGFVASRAHWNDIGGAVPLSVQTDAKEIFAEGLLLPVVPLYRGGSLDEAVMDILRANVRDSVHQIGDLNAQIAASRVGSHRLRELTSRYGADTVAAAVAHVQDATERRVRRRLAELPEFVVHGEDFLDDDGAGGPPTRIAVRVAKGRDAMHLDFAGTDPTNASGYNMTLCALTSACRVVFKALTDASSPANDGSFRPLTVNAPPGSVVHALPPTAVSLYGEPARRAIDAVWRALAGVLAGKLPAGHYGTIAGLAMAGWDDRRAPREWVSFQGPNNGGWGAFQGGDGESALCCITNGDTRNTPAEIIESKVPLRVWRHELRADSGGPGEWRGGLGIVYEFEVLTAAPWALTCALGRTDFAPFGAYGGDDGAVNGIDILDDGEVVASLKRRTAFALRKAQRIVLRTGGGGGFGTPGNRSRAAVEEDLRRGYITVDAARRSYGVGADRNAAGTEGRAT